MRAVPKLSLKQYLHGSQVEQTDFERQLFEALKDYGFVIIKEHDIALDLIHTCYQKSKQFFNLEEAVKRQYISKSGGGQRGYTPFGTEHAKDNSLPDLKEFYHVGREYLNDQSIKDYFPDNVWPDDSVEDFQNTFLTLYTLMDQLGQVLLKAIEKPLGVSTGFLSHMAQNGNSILRLIHYPALGKLETKGAVRAFAHGDINLITLLVGATDSGLELLDRDGKWLAVESEPHEIVVDSGDMLSRITNDVIPTTIHRVVNPDNLNQNRYSMPFFVHPHPHAELSCLESCIGKGAKYPPISSHDFLLQRLKEIGLMG